MDPRRRNAIIFIVAIVVIVLVIVIVIVATGNGSSNTSPPTVSPAPAPPSTKTPDVSNLGYIGDILVTSDSKTVVTLRDIGVIRFLDTKTDYKLPAPPNAAADVTSSPSCLAEISTSILVVGTEDGCIYKFNRDSGSFVLVVDNSDKLDSVNGYSNMAIYKALTIASNGQLYAANYSMGVIEVYDSGTFAFVGALTISSGYAPIGIVIDTDQKMFVLVINLSTDIGIVVQNGKSILTNINKPIGMKLCSPNKLQIATSNSVLSYDVSTLNLLGTLQLGESITALSCSQVAQNGNLISY